jgi:crooked neck
VAKVQGMMPIVGRKQHVDKETGQAVEGKRFPHLLSMCNFNNPCTDADWELVFADDEREANPTSFRFLQMAHAWRNSQARRTGGSGLLSGFTATTSTDEDGVADTRANADVEVGRADDAGSDASSSDGQ